VYFRELHSRSPRFWILNGNGKIRKEMLNTEVADSRLALTGLSRSSAHGCRIFARGSRFLSPGLNATRKQWRSAAYSWNAGLRGTPGKPNDLDSDRPWKRGRLRKPREIETVRSGVTVSRDFLLVIGTNRRINCVS
jgi:hypothetical protein